MKETSLTRYAWISVGAAVITIGLKTGAWQLTGSVGLLSDAMESVVNLIGALMALAMLMWRRALKMKTTRMDTARRNTSPAESREPLF